VTEQASPQLLWVTSELAGTLRDARIALEEFADNPNRPEAIERCAHMLHQAHGALRIAEVYGASLLADEMEQLALHLHRSVGSGLPADEGLDALSRAIVQLQPYLERVTTGGRDIPLVLLPLLNDLRAARGSPLLSENTLLLLNLPSDQHLLARGARPQPSGEDLVALARKLRPRYQVALLNWIRGERPDSSLAVIADVAASFERAAAEMSVYQLWWVLGGVVEALRQGGLPPSAAIKRLLGQVDRQIRRIVDEGEAGLAAAPPVELLNSLLFYVARSSTRGSRVSLIRDTFSLGDLLPDLGDLADARDSLGGPSVQLMHTVATAIREDLAKVKDTLDLHARTSSIPREVLDNQFALLNKIGDTLGVLGLGDFRDEVQAEAERLRGVLDKPPGEAEEDLLAVAAALLRVEDRLDGRLVGLVVEEPAAPDKPPEDAGEIELRQVREALLRECLINMARVRDAINERLSGPIDPQLADAVPDLLRSITAALLMLDYPRAVTVLERITARVRVMVEPGAEDMHRGALDRLADAIVSVEYFMETVRAGRKMPVFMLENAESCLDAMPALESVVPDYAPVDEPPGETITMHEEVEAAPSYPGLPVLPELPAPAQAAPPPDPRPRPEASAPVYAGEDEPDAELIELFIEEAKELDEQIREHFPGWAQDGNLVELGIVRRAFHTIKGSGRMVGAKLIGEYAWSIERLMNTLLEQRIERSPPLVQFLGQAVVLLPALIEQLETGRVPQADVPAWIEQASAFADGRPDAVETSAALLAGSQVAGETEPASAPLPEPAQEPGPAPSEMDPVLREIFTREASGHLDSLRTFINGCAVRTAPYAVTEDAHRASHTLAGSANMADVTPAVAIARPLNEYLRHLYDDHVGVPDAGIAMLQRAVEAIEAVVESLREGLDPGPADESLATEIRTLHEDYQLRAEAGATTTLPEEAQFDAEILGLFCEEAAEILEEAQGAMAAWRAQPGSGEPLRALQRHLHTIKGGARLAGVRSIGDLSHDLETLFESLAEDGRASQPGLFDLVQHCLDAIHGMRDAAAGGHMPEMPPGLHERLVSALAGGAVAEEVDSQTAEAGEPPAETQSTAEEHAVEEEGPVDGQPAEKTQLGEEPPAEEEPPVEEPPAEEPPAEEPPAEESPAEEPPAEEPPVEEPPAEEPPVEEPPVEEPPAEEPPVEEPPAREEPAPVEEPPAEQRPPAIATPRQETARVDAELLESLLNNAGEVGIYRARLEEQLGSVQFNLEELTATFIRLRDQLRKMEIETEKQIIHRHQGERDARGDFDPLELDRYSTIQQLSRALAETASDVASIQQLISERIRESESLIVQQSRAVSELQDGLMRTRLVPFNRLAQRLSRLVRQVASEYGRQAELHVVGGTAELDRQIVDRMLGPLEHLLRNAVIHGIEPPARRVALSKPETGRVTVSVLREGAEIVVEVSDDGGGLDLAAIRRKALTLGLIGYDDELGDGDAARMILRPGFSTAQQLTQGAGRGVGMDVVASEVRQLGGALEVHNRPGEGALFEIRLPFTRAITQALVLRAADEWYALPLPAVEGVVRIPAGELSRYVGATPIPFRYGDDEYTFEHIGALVEGHALPPPEIGSVPAILVRAGDRPTAILTDEMLGAREIVVKPLGPQLTGIRGIAGATVLGDGRIVLILDIAALIRARARAPESPPPLPAKAKEDDRTFVMVVDDSITVRRVTERLLERNGMRVITAKDGVDALSLLQENMPDVMLLDIEMPRMDGYEVAGHVRNDARLRHIPIVMITSRVGDKHRNRAMEIGVDQYLGKPYQESDLLTAISTLVNRRERAGDE
jgi:chemosensory pili system protein ChpA (sensor histidine kinase/response regulator)